jgi:putative transposase
MPRSPRIVIPGMPHHIVQRGNRRQPTFFSPDDYRTYIQIAAKAFAAAKVEVWAYCLMPNHVHLIATPETEDGLAKAVGATHQHYTWLINQRQGWTGHLWQGRFGSCPMDEPYFLLCARYVGLNPVRAGLASKAVDWPWSSVGAHLTKRPDALLSPAPLIDLLGPEVTTFFDTDVPESCRRRFHGALDSGLPLTHSKGGDAVGDTPKGMSPS